MLCGRGWWLQLQQPCSCEPCSHERCWCETSRIWRRVETEGSNQMPIAKGCSRMYINGCKRQGASLCPFYIFTHIHYILPIDPVKFVCQESGAHIVSGNHILYKSLSRNAMCLSQTMGNPPACKGIPQILAASVTNHGAALELLSKMHFLLDIFSAKPKYARRPHL